MVETDPAFDQLGAKLYVCGSCRAKHFNVKSSHKPKPKRELVEANLPYPKDS